MGSATLCCAEGDEGKKREDWGEQGYTLYNVYNTYKIETPGGEPAPRGIILSKGLLPFSVFSGREKRPDSFTRSQHLLTWGASQHCGLHHVDIPSSKPHQPKLGKCFFFNQNHYFTSRTILYSSWEDFCGIATGQNCARGHRSCLSMGSRITEWVKKQ